MATYKGNDIIKPDQLDEDIKRTMQPRPGLENIEEDLNLPPSAEPDYVPRPGQKHFKENMIMADQRPPVRRIPTGVSGNPKPLDPNDPRNTPQFEGEMQRDKGYISPSTLDTPPGARGYKRGGAVKKNPFEKSKRDVEPPGMVEGSPKEEAYDRQQMMGFNQGGMVTKHGSSTHVSCNTKHR